MINCNHNHNNYKDNQNYNNHYHPKKNVTKYLLISTYIYKWTQGATHLAPHVQQELYQILLLGGVYEEKII